MVRVFDLIDPLLDYMDSRATKYQHNTINAQSMSSEVVQRTTPHNEPSIHSAHPHNSTADNVDLMLARLASNNGAGHSQKTTAGLWWTAALFIVINHIVVVLSLYYYPISDIKLLYGACIFAWLQLLGVTAGYHRLWSHRTYTANIILRTFLAITGLMSFQGSARWWALRHRLHHRFTDTALDPYNATRGLLYSHIGWLFEPPPAYTRLSIVNARDLDNDIVCVYQKKYLLYGYIIFGVVLQGICGWVLCNDISGGIIYIGGTL